MAVDLQPVAIDIIIVVFLSIALYNVLELNFSIFTTFKRRNGLYFWSFTIATYGIAFNAVGYMLRHTAGSVPPNAYATLILIGWCTMVTGQSVVLYSRLHIVMHNEKLLRGVLVMIITNAVILHIPIIVIVYGINSGNPVPFQNAYNVYEKLQLTVFCVQELIISGLYVWETTKLLRLEKTIGNTGTRRVMNHLIYVNLFVMLLDFSIVGLEFANLFEIQTAWKPFVYSAKLKLEFSILNRLVELTRNARSGHSASASAYGYGHRNNRTATNVPDVALDTLKSSGAMNVHASASRGHQQQQHTQYEVHVSGDGNTTHRDAHPAGDSAVMMTTEIQIQSHSRRRGSRVTSLAESGKEILAESKEHEERGVETGSTSSVMSDPPRYRYDNHGWK
ncbi:integral membrane protein [Plectosphaerella plurivora]|uniref:Integral membrane protein n=1 Tax=Plectosphaerella plurivora TaxID=936078 RepID=A0A9P8V3D1_9PEZI|nr:integral membrane protein [Plectosphaerella plurivora]